MFEFKSVGDLSILELCGDDIGKSIGRLCIGVQATYNANAGDMGFSTFIMRVDFA